MRLAIALAAVPLALAFWMLPARASGDVETQIRALSQAFSDASASGDAAVLARLLDDDVVFINENGDVSSKRDVVDSAGPPPAGVTNTLVQTDFKVRLHGSVAVTSFTDVSTLLFHGQTLVSKFLSTEVWLDESGNWRMISSQTLALQNDPPAVVLSQSDLDGYAGTYAAGPGYSVAIARSGNELTASVNGGAPVRLEAELRDVFFVPGQPRVRRIFQRDASGRVIGYVSRREGHDIVLKRSS